MAWLKWISIILSVLMGLATAGNAASTGLSYATAGDASGLTFTAATGAATVGFAGLSWLPYVLGILGLFGKQPASLTKLIAAVNALLKTPRDPVAWMTMLIAVVDFLDDALKALPQDNPQVQTLVQLVAQFRQAVHALFADPNATQAIVSAPPKFAASGASFSEVIGR